MIRFFPRAPLLRRDSRSPRTDMGGGAPCLPVRTGPSGSDVESDAAPINDDAVTGEGQPDLPVAGHDDVDGQEVVAGLVVLEGDLSRIAGAARRGHVGTDPH